MKISTGSEIFDRFLEGGYDNGVITTIYGPAGSGKTNLMLIATISILKKGKKVIFIDTESNFSVERFKQLTSEELMENIIFIKPYTFEEQHNAIMKLKDMINEDIGMIIIDSIGALYRLEKDDISDSNKNLGIEMGRLVALSAQKKIPIIMTNQVYSSFEDKEKVSIVGGDIIKYTSKTLIELKKGHNGMRIAVIKKHRSIAEGKEIKFRIFDKGITNS